MSTDKVMTTEDFDLLREVNEGLLLHIDSLIIERDEARQENAALRERLAEVQRRVTEQCGPKPYSHDYGDEVVERSRCSACGNSGWGDTDIVHDNDCLYRECIAALATAEGEVK